MRENTVRCALWLQKQNVKSGDVVTICTHNHLDAYIPCIATFLVGAIYNPWHHEVNLSNYFLLIYYRISGAKICRKKSLMASDRGSGGDGGEKKLL